MARQSMAIRLRSKGVLASLWDCRASTSVGLRNYLKTDWVYYLRDA